MKIRIRFSKEGAMKFIGHLDMMRYFQKAFRRADVDIQYSQGYSPHQLISFAAPLGVGLTSEGEYMDIFVNDCLPSAQMIERMNAEMVEGVSVLSFKQIDDETKNSNAMSLIAAADYFVRFKEDSVRLIEPYSSGLPQFMAMDSVMITKKTKKSTADVDIRPMIYEMRADKDGLFMKLACGSSANLKPELVMQAFSSFLKQPFDELALNIRRIDMYAKAPDGNGLISLDAMGRDIL